MLKFIVRALIFLMGVLLMIVSCALNEQSDDDSLRGLINGKYRDYFSDYESMDDGGEIGGGGEGVLGTAYLYPWGRKLGSIPSREISISIQGDTAQVYIWSELVGEFLVDTTMDGQINPGSKPIHDVHEKYAEFVRVGEREWKLTRISCGEFHLYDSTKQTVFITSVHVYDTDGDVDLMITDPTTLLDVETEIPVFEAGELVYVEVTVENNSSYDWVPPHFVYLHFPGGRDLFYNTGDDVHFQGSWVPYNPGVHHAGVDIINSNCLQNETEDDYDSGAWGLPYIVQ